MAASTLSFGMLAPRAFCRARRSDGLSLGFGPPAFTAMAMSLLMRVKTFAILFHRANMVALRVSKMRPMDGADTPGTASRASSAWDTIPGRGSLADLPAPAMGSLRAGRRVPGPDGSPRPWLRRDPRGARSGDAEPGAGVPPQLLPGLDSPRVHRGPGLDPLRRSRGRTASRGRSHPGP